MSSQNLTQYQLNALTSVIKLIKEFPYSPTIEEIAKDLKIPKYLAYDRLKALRIKEYITWQDNKPRTIQIKKTYKLDTHAKRF
jgi:SOS-response transcriptional repressor LexA